MYIMRALVVLAFVALVAGAPSSGPERIVGGSVANLNQYPYIASLLHSRNLQVYYQACGGVIITNRSILTAAHCIYGWPAGAWRMRVGSQFANSGGVIYQTSFFTIHPSYNPYNHDSDIAIIRTASTISMSPNTVALAYLANPNYVLADNQVVWAAGWGSTVHGGQQSEQLRHVQMWSVNQVTCRNNYATRNRNITDNMLCAGNLSGGGRDQCIGDEGGPLIHNGNVVGLTSWIGDCGLAQFPSVNTRISRFAQWIQNNF